MADRPKPTPYERLVATTLSPDERAERKRATTRLSLEARRRATTVLIQRHKATYDKIYKAEREALSQDPRYRQSWRTQGEAS